MAEAAGTGLDVPVNLYVAVAAILFASELLASHRKVPLLRRCEFGMTSLLGFSLNAEC